jgi:hypothetical protein
VTHLFSHPCLVERNVDLIRLPAEHDPAWDRFVAVQAAGTPYHTSSWRRVIEACFPFMSGFVLGLRDSGTGEICGGLPIFHIKSGFRGSRLLAVPHASFCEPLAGNERERSLLCEAALQQGMALGVKCVQLRCRPSKTPIGPAENHGPFLHHFLHLDRPLGEIWNSLSRTAVRRMVAKAEKAGITVRTATQEAEIDQFCALLLRTRRRLGLPALPSRFIRALSLELPESHRTLFLAYKGDKLAAGVLATKGSGLFILESYAEEEAVGRSGINSLLYWRALVEAHRTGHRQFSFGRTNGNNEGLAAYKRHWGVVEEPLHYTDLLRPSDRSHQGSTASFWRPAARLILRWVPLPIYRALSSFFFQHWA